MSLTEFEIIQHYFQLPNADADIETGMGDDAAVMTLTDGFDHQIVSVSILLQRFLDNHLKPDSLAIRALVSLITELYCQAKIPKWLTLNLALMKADPEWLKYFATGLSTASKQYHLALVGGDTTSGTNSILLRLFALGKSQRRPSSTNRLVYITRYPGRSALAEQDLQNHSRLAYRRTALLQQYTHPVVNPGYFELIDKFAIHACSLKNGLFNAIKKINTFTSTKAVIDLDQITLDQELLLNLNSNITMQSLYTAAEISEICFTISAEEQTALEHYADNMHLTPVCIGKSCK